MDIGKKRDIFTLWFLWFYFKAPKRILEGWRNYLRFGLYFFSIDLLFKTFFSPWRGYLWEYPRGFGFEDVEVFISNMASRIIGALMRTLLIIGGIIIEAFIFLSGIVIFLAWLILPVILMLGLLFAFLII